MAHAAQHQTLPELIQYVIEHSGLAEHYRKQKEGTERLENLQELVNAAVIFGQEEELRDFPAGQIPPAVHEQAAGAMLEDIPATPLAAMSPLAAFLTHASLGAGDPQAFQGQQAERLRTVQAAKGLGLEVGFVPGPEGGIFPLGGGWDRVGDPGE